jgi:hypothetical protein
MSEWFKKTGAMEGACGQILETENAGVVVKRIKRRQAGGNRSKCHDAGKQCEIQSWTSALLRPVNGFSLLFTPRAWHQASSTGETDKRAYAMERIDCSTEVNPGELNSESPELAELRLFYEKSKAAGIYPCDYELYRQPDGRLGLIDFDKFGSWTETENGDEVVFPWGLTGKPLYPW